MVSVSASFKSYLSLLLCAKIIEGFVPQTTYFSKSINANNKATQLYSVSPESSQDTRREWFQKLCSVASIASLKTKPSNAETLKLTTPPNSALCDPQVSSWYRGSRIIHILGTAHISEESAQVAGKLVREVQPKAVFVELDAKRVGRVLPKANRDTAVAATDGFMSSDKYLMPVSAVPPAEASPASMTLGFNPLGIRDGLLRRAGGALVGDSIRRLYQNLENQGFSAGEEFAIAIREGLNIDATIVLGDQDVNYTLQRLAEAISKTDLKKLMSPDSEFEKSISDLLPSQVKDQLQPDSTLDAKQLSMFVETMKTKENVKRIMDNFKLQAPEIYNAMVGERDLFMAKGLDMLEPFDCTVAVMGLAHLDGVEQNLKRKGWEPLPVKCR